ncbi:hypothetical protein DS957_003485 [Vibrio harveyi]|uniref:Uncharacterized protein n=1 Tax=Vibrio harveyi TaxID=669 RepID=A0A8B3DMB0_VIBHA|nr:hypothetical protein DS957_003485 [Vibrio harveyi]
MGQIRFSMNGFRANLVSEMSELRTSLADVLNELSESDREDVIDKFDEVACSVNSLLHVSIEGNDDFKNMEGSAEVDLLGNYDE